MQIDGTHQCFYDLGRLQEYIGGGDLLGIAEELVADRQLLDELETRVAGVDEFETKHFSSVFGFRLYRIVIYALVRILRPQLAVETGVLHGLTSAFVLRALEKNGEGNLVSVDLPSYPEEGPSNKDGYDACLPKGTEPGWVVPDTCRDRWDLRLGRSVDLLPELLEKSGPIGLFIHDSEHTYSTMWAEFNLAWPALSEGGVLLCDNVSDNAAFFDFCRRVGRQPLMLSAPDSRRLAPVRFALICR